MKTLFLFFSLLLLIAVSPLSHAYIGPGLGLAAIGVALGVIVSVLLSFLAIFWYPIKRLLNKRRKLPTTENLKTQDIATPESDPLNDPIDDSDSVQ